MGSWEQPRICLGIQNGLQDICFLSFRLIAVKNSHFSLLQASKLETPKLHRWALFGISEYLVVPFTEFWSQCPRWFFCHTHWTYPRWKPGKTCLHLGYFGISHCNFKGDFCEKDGQCSDMVWLVWFLFFQLNHSQTNYSKICLIPAFKYIRTMSQIE